MYRQAIARQSRLLSTTAATRKSATESAKEALKSVDKTISQAAVKGIEKGRTYAPAHRRAFSRTASLCLTHIHIYALTYP